MLKLKRAYERPAREDGQRFLVERLWPRGLKKSALRLDAWLKDVAPSTELRKWFSHDPRKWVEFQKRYRSELKQHAEVCDRIVEAARQGTVTLVYAAHDPDRNSAVVLRNYLKNKIAVNNSDQNSAA
ncbi:MAG TPA: DUF488 domain-containing protein [Terriglobales bacterium]|jgi:uncharacterized protein YeaO (DUF488 family)|nr:DUF488 domain-containing protein [Terriglobales bacterium]